MTIEFDSGFVACLEWDRPQHDFGTGKEHSYINVSKPTKSIIFCLPCHLKSSRINKAI